MRRKEREEGRRGERGQEEGSRGERGQEEKEGRRGERHTLVETRSPMVFRNFQAVSILTFGVPQPGSSEEARVSSLSIVG